MNVNFFDLEKIKDNLETVLIFSGMLILYFNIYLYFCILLSIFNTKLLLYFYSNFDNLNIDLKFSFKNKEENKQKIQDFETESDMGNSVIFSNDEDTKHPEWKLKSN